MGQWAGLREVQIIQVIATTSLLFLVAGTSRIMKTRMIVGALFAIRLAGDAPENRIIWLWHLQKSAASSRTKQWWHLGKCDVTDFLCQFRDTDSPYAGHFGDVGYKRRVGNILGLLCDTNIQGGPRILCRLSTFPFFLHYLIIIPLELLDFERNTHDQARAILAALHNLKLLASQLSPKSQLFTEHLSYLECWIGD